MNKPLTLRTNIVLGSIYTLALIIGLLFAFTAHANNTVHHNQPDWTVANCSVWTNTSHPVLPKYTRTDECVAPDGSLIVAGK